MGGIGSGRLGGASCTDSMHPLDLRAIKRAGLLTPGRCASWQWSRGAETVASINLRVESDSVVLDYRNRSPHHHGGEWEPLSYTVRLAWTPCGFGGRRAWWLCALLSVAGGAWRCCTVVGCSHAGGATSSPIEANAKRPMTERPGGPIPCVGGWAGCRAC